MSCFCKCTIKAFEFFNSLVYKLDIENKRNGVENEKFKNRAYNIRNYYCNSNNIDSWISLYNYQMNYQERKTV